MFNVVAEEQETHQIARHSYIHSKPLSEQFSSAKRLSPTSAARVDTNPDPMIVRAAAEVAGSIIWPSTTGNVPKTPSTLAVAISEYLMVRFWVALLTLRVNTLLSRPLLGGAKNVSSFWLRAVILMVSLPSTAAIETS